MNGGFDRAFLHKIGFQHVHFEWLRKKHPSIKNYTNPYDYDGMLEGVR